MFYVGYLQDYSSALTCFQANGGDFKNILCLAKKESGALDALGACRWITFEESGSLFPLVSSHCAKLS